MEKDLEKRENHDLTKGKFPEELKPFEKGVGPTVSVGKVTGNIISDMIDTRVRDKRCQKRAN